MKKLMPYIIVFVLIAVISFLVMRNEGAKPITEPEISVTIETPAAAEETATSSPVQSPVAGLQIQDIKVGTGEEAENGDSVTVNYVGTFTDGEEFDSSKQPFQFTLGGGRVIKGWDLGVLGMKVGGKRKLTIAPELGYGIEGKDIIPPNAILIFEVELLKVEKPANIGTSSPEK